MHIRPPSDYAVAQTAPALRALADAALTVRTASGSIAATAFVWRDPASLPNRDGINFDGLASDPVGAACRAETRRIGAWLAPHGSDTMEAACETAADEDPRRSDFISTAWAGLPGWQA